VLVPVDERVHTGAALGAPERRAAPVAAGDQLERARRDLFPGFGDADDDAGSPAAVAAFQSGAHHFRVAGRVERIIGAAVGDLQHLLDDLCSILVPAVDAVGP